jgi:uncharacterized protein YydD (DUF2326 family)
MTEKNFKEDMHKQFQLWESEFQKMQSELKSAAKKARIATVIDDDLESLHAQMIEAWDQLEKLDASGETWDDFRNSFDEVWKNLQTVVDEVVERYKHTSF